MQTTYDDNVKIYILQITLKKLSDILELCNNKH